MSKLNPNLKFVVSLLGVAWTTINAATGSHLPAWSPPVATAIAAALVWLVPNIASGVKTPLVLTAGEADVIRRMLASVKVVPASPAGTVQPPATTTGPAT